ncbi:NAD-dependent epimerase/dehydratase family protein, partial [Pseudomonas savastanoi]
MVQLTVSFSGQASRRSSLVKIRLLNCHVRHARLSAMHILLTGGTGLIGRALCRFWSAQGHELTVWSRKPADVAE